MYVYCFASWAHTISILYRPGTTHMQTHDALAKQFVLPEDNLSAGRNASELQIK